MALSIAFVSALFWAGIYGMHTVRSSFRGYDGLVESFLAEGE